MTIEVVSGTGATFEYDPLQDRESNTGYNDGRPSAALPRRSRDIVGHWEVDTVLGPGRPCILSLVERKTGYVVIGKL